MPSAHRQTALCSRWASSHGLLLSCVFAAKSRQGTAKLSVFVTLLRSSIHFGREWVIHANNHDDSLTICMTHARRIVYLRLPNLGKPFLSPPHCLSEKTICIMPSPSDLHRRVRYTGVAASPHSHEVNRQLEPMCCQHQVIWHLSFVINVVDLSDQGLVSSCR